MSKRSMTKGVCRIFETKQVTDNYKILTSCNGINDQNITNNLGMFAVVDQRTQENWLNFPVIRELL